MPTTAILERARRRGPGTTITRAMAVRARLTLAVVTISSEVSERRTQCCLSWAVRRLRRTRKRLDEHHTCPYCQGIVHENGDGHLDACRRTARIGLRAAYAAGWRPRYTPDRRVTT